MSIENDIYFIESLGLKNFTRKGFAQYNFSCPICGDSKKDSKKARGYLRINKFRNGLSYKCFNCGASASNVYWFLRQFDKQKAFEYSSMSVNNLNRPKKIYTKSSGKLKIRFNDSFYLSRLQELTPKAKAYLKSRNVPEDIELYSSTAYMNWVNTILPEEYSNEALEYDAERLVIPFRDKQGNIFAFQGRSLDPNEKIRYLSALVNREIPLVYGFNKVDYEKPLFFVEGVFDSFFVDNSLAVCSSGILNFVKKFIKKHDIDKDKVVLIYDNDLDNTDIMKLQEKSINQGFKVYQWKSEILNRFEDIAEAGKHIPKETINKIIRKEVNAS